MFQNSASHNADNAISTYGNKTAKNTNTADVMSIEDGLKQEVSEVKIVKSILHSPCPTIANNYNFLNSNGSTES